MTKQRERGIVDERGKRLQINVRLTREMMEWVKEETARRGGTVTEVVVGALILRRRLGPLIEGGGASDARATA